MVSNRGKEIVKYQSFLSIDDGNRLDNYLIGDVSNALLSKGILNDGLSQELGGALLSNFVREILQANNGCDGPMPCEEEPFG